MRNDYTTMKPNKTSDVRIKTYIEPGLASPTIPRPFVEEVNPAARGCRLYAKEFQQHGLTIACACCKAISRGSKVAVNHSEWCRARIESELVKYPEGKSRIEASGNRINHDLAERVERAQCASGGAATAASEAKPKGETRGREDQTEEQGRRKKVRFEETDQAVEIGWGWQQYFDQYKG